MQSIKELERTLQFVNKGDKLETLLKLSALYLDSDLKKTLIHTRSAKKLAKKLKLKKEEAESDHLTAEVLFITGKYRKAIEFLENSEILYNDIDDRDGLCNTLLDLGKNYWKLSEYKKTLELYFEALDISDKQADIILQSEIMNNISLIYVMLEDFDTAVKYLNKVMKILKIRENESGIFTVLINLGIIAFKQDNLKEARAKISEALKIAEKIDKSEYIATASNNLGVFLIKEDKYENALDLFLGFVDILEEDNRAIWVFADLLSNIATCYFRLNDYSEAEKYALRSITIAREIESKELIVKNLEIQVQLSLEQEKFRNAYEASTELHELKNRLYDKKVAAKIAEVRLKSKHKIKSKNAALTGEKQQYSEDILDKRIFEIIDGDGQFQLIIESSEDLFTLHDRKGKYIYCNRPFLFSIRSEDIIGKSPYNFYKFEYGDLLVRHLKKSFSSGKSDNIETMIEIEGQEKWFSHYIYPVYDKDGNILAAAMVSKYLSEEPKDRAEENLQVDKDIIQQMEDLKVNQDYWRSFQEDVRKFVTFRIELFDEGPIKQKVVFFSSSLKDILGISIADDFAKWFANIHPEEKNNLVKNFSNSVKKGLYLNEHLRIFHPEKDQYQWVNLILDPVLDKTNKVTFFNGIVTDINDQKNKEEQLLNKLQEAELHKDMLDISSQPFLLTTPDGKITEHNNAFSKLCGLSNKAISDLNWISDLIADESAKTEEKAIQKLISSGNPQNYETILSLEKGKLFAEINAHPLQDSDGELDKICYFINDISSHKNLIKSLKDSQTDLQSLLQKLPELILEIDENGVVINLILTPLAINLGLDKNAAGKKLEEIYHNSISQKISKAVQESIEHKRSVKLEFSQTTDENAYWLEGEVVSRTDHSALMILHDVTSLKEIEYDLKQKGERYLKLFENSPEPIFTLNKDLYFIEANQVMLDLLGYTSHELGKLKLSDLEVISEDGISAAEKLKQGEEFSNLEYEIELKDGKHILVLHSSAIFKDDNDNISTFHNTWLDISQRKMMTTKIQQQYLDKEEEYLQQVKKLNKDLSNQAALINEPEHYAFFRLEIDIDNKDPVKVLHYNPSLTRLIGIGQPENFDNWFNNVAEKDVERLLSAIKQSIGTGKNLDEIFQLNHPDLKQSRWLRIIVEPVKNRSGIKFINGSIFDVTEQKSREFELLRDLEEIVSFTNVLQEVSQPFAICTPEGKFTKVNTAFCDLTGYKEKDLINKRHWNKLFSDNSELSFDSDSFKNNRSIIIEKGIARKDGTISILNIIFHPHFDKDYNLETLFCFATDISDYKLALMDLEDSSADLGSVIEVLPQVIFELDHNGKVLDVLKTSYDFKYPLTDSDIGKKIHTIFPAASANDIVSAVQNCIRNGAKINMIYSIITEDSIRWFEAIISYKSNNSVTFVSRETTELIDLMHKIQDNKSKFEMIFQNSLIPMFTLDIDFNFLDVNPIGEELLGIVKSELLNKNLRDFEIEENSLISPYNQLLKGRSIENFEQQLTSAYNQDITFLNYSYPVKNKEGEIEQIQCLWVDISDRKQIEDEMRSQQDTLGRSNEDATAKLKTELIQLQSFINETDDQAFFRIAIDGSKADKKDVIFTNPILAKFLDIKEPDIFENWFENIHTDDLDLIKEIFSTALKAGPAVTETFRVTTGSSKTIKWLQITIKSVLNSDDKTGYLNGLITDITEIKVKENSLVGSIKEAKIASDILQRSSQPYAHSTQGGKLLDVNTAFCDLTGYSKNELLKAISWIGFLAPSEWFEQGEEIVQNIITEGSSQRVDIELIRKDGKEISVELLINPDHNKEKTDIFIFASDISEKTEFISFLQRSEQDLLAILGNLPQLILELDHNGRINSVLNSFSDERLVKFDELEDNTIYSIFPGSSADKILTSVQKCLKNGKNEYFQFSFEADDRAFWFEADLIYNNKDMVIFTSRDITERIELENNLLQISEKYINNVDNSLIPFFTFDENYKFSYANSAGLKLLNITEKEISGNSLADFERNPGDLTTKIEQIFKGKNIAGFEQEILDSGNNVINILNYSYPIKEKAGSIKKFNSFWIDISDRKLIENELKSHKEDMEKSTEDKISKLKTELAQLHSLIDETEDYAFFRIAIDEKKAERKNVILTSPNFGKLLNIKNPKIFDNWSVNVHPDDIDLWKEIFSTALKTGSPINDIFRLTAESTDTLKWLQITIKPVLNSDGKPVYLNGLITDLSELKAKEQLLIGSIKEATIASDVLQRSSQPYAHSTLGGKLLNVNTAFCELTGYRKDELFKAVTWMKLLTPVEWHEHGEDVVLNVVTERSPQRVELELIRNDNNRISVELLINPDQDEEKTDIFIFANDITEKTKAISSLQRSEQDLLAIMGNLPLLILELDHNGKIITILNSSSDDHLGKIDKLKSSAIDHIYKGSVAATILESIQKCLKNGKNEYLQFSIEAEDRSFWYEADLVYKTKDSVIFTSREITDRIDLENNFLDISKKYNNSVDNSLIPFFTFDDNYKFFYANPAGLKLLNITEIELSRKSLADFENNSGDLTTKMEQIFKGKNIAGFEQEIKDSKNNVITILNYSYPIKNKAGKIRKFNSYWIDIRDRKLFEDELKLRKDDLEKSVDYRVGELKGDLKHYESFVSNQDIFGVFRAKIEGKRSDKIDLIFANKILFDILEVSGTDDFNDLLKKFPEKTALNLKEQIRKAEADGPSLDEVIELNTDPESPKKIRLILNITENPSDKLRYVNGIVSDVTKQIMKETELLDNIDSITRIEQILYDSNQPFAIINLDKKILNYNPAFKKLTGYTTSDLTELNWDKTINSIDELETENKIMKDIISTGKAQKFERKLLRKDGSTIVIEIHAHAGADQHNNNKDIYLFLNDISSYKDLILNLEQAGTDLQNLFGSFPGSILEIDDQCNIVQAISTAMLEIFDLPGEVSGKALNNVFPIKISKKLTDSVNKCSKERSNNKIEFSFQNDENEYWLEVETVYHSENRIMLLLRDISSRKEIEFKTASLGDEYRSLYMNSPLPVFTMDKDLKFIAPNQQGLKMLGYSAEELKNMKLTDLELDQNRSPSAAEKLLKGEELINFEQLIKCKDGTQLTVLHNSYPVKDKKGSVITFQSAFIDISARKEMENELRSKFSNKEKSADIQLKELGENLKQFESYIHDSHEFAVFRLKLNSEDPQQHKIILSSPSLKKLLHTEQIASFAELFKNIYSDDLEKIKLSNIESAKDGSVFDEIFRLQRTKENGLRWIRMIFDPIRKGSGQGCANGIVFDITVLKKAETELKRNESLLKELITHTPYAFYSYSPDFTLTYMSKDFMTIVGLRNKNKDLKWTDLISKTHINKSAIKLSTNAIKTGVPTESFKMEIASSDGTLIPVEVREAPVVQNSKTVAMVGVISEIRVEEKIASGLDIMVNAINSFELPIIVTDPEYNIILCNDKIAELLGFTDREEIIGDSLLTIVKKEDRDNFKDLVKKNIKKSGKWVSEYNILREDNTQIKKQLTVTPFKGWDENEDFLAVSFEDIEGISDLLSELELLREELNLKEETKNLLIEDRNKLDQTIQISRIGSWEWHIKSGEIQCSNEFFKIIGLNNPRQNQDIVFLEDLIHPDSETEFSDFMDQVKNGVRDFDGNLKILDANNNEKLINLKTRTFLKDGNPNNLLGIVMDLSPFVKVETDQQEVAEPASKIIKVSQNSELQVITHILDKDPDFSSKGKNFLMLKEIEERAEVVSMILQQVINSKDGNTVNFQKYLQLLAQNIGKKIGRTKLASMRINAKNIELPLEKAIPCGLIINELVSNSIKYAFPESRKSFFDNVIKIDLVRENNIHTLTVSDNGVGLPKDFDFELSGSVGLRLVRLWSQQQLDSSFSIDPLQKNGVLINFSFSV